MKKVAQFLEKKGLKIVGNLVTGNISGAIGEVLDSAGLKNASEDEIIAKLNEDKELMMKLKDIELQETQMILEDKQNAREREIKISTNERASWLNRNINSIMALAFMLTYFSLNAYVIINKLINPAMDKMETLFAVVVSYYFGAMKRKGDS